MYKILKKVKKEFLKELAKGEGGGGLCYSANRAGLTPEEREKFKEYLRKSKKDQVEFFTVCGELVFDSSQFYWEYNDSGSRINWLNLHITKNS